MKQKDFDWRLGAFRFWCCCLGLIAPAFADAPPAPSIVFRETTREWGLDFRYANGSRGMHDLPEIMGGGVAAADFDGDGRLDLYFCNGGPIGPPRSGSDRSPDFRCRLFLNRLPGRFVDVTNTANAPGPSYAMGAATGDIDGDGRIDLFVTGWRDQRFYRNLGGGRFEDITRKAGLESKLWSTSAAFADLDGDGDLDLYVANYLEFDPSEAPFCSAPDGKRDYCGPEDFPAQPDRLYRNNGDGTFSDVSRMAGIDRAERRGLGVLIAELTGDHRPDIYVANDGNDCCLFANQGDLRFSEIGETAGVARDGKGNALAGMGVALGDLNGDGVSDLAVTNFLGRSTIAFQAPKDRKGPFVDVSADINLARITRDVLGFGIAIVDFDGDGRLDLLQANGHVLDRARLGVPFSMRMTLLKGVVDQPILVDVSRQAGSAFDRMILARGLAVGDFDGDLRPDAVVAALDAPSLIVRNESNPGKFAILDVVNRWGRPAIGARIRVSVNGRILAREVVAGGSYLSASEQSIFLGVGDTSRIDRIEVDWPWGGTEVRHELISVGKRSRIVELLH